jgi:pimeloyl-ACP methyl ester carboxylesterase
MPAPIDHDPELAGFAAVHVSAPDGLKLHVRDYRPTRWFGRPVVCLPGLSRTAADFHELAQSLVADRERPRRVLALDYRGRGQSEYDSDHAKYALAVELADVAAIMTALELSPAVFVGTSRGGLLAMLLGATRPTAVGGVVLNDVGPVVEPQGLMRIKGSLGKLPTPRSFEEGADILRRLNGVQFPRMTPEEWMRQARRTWTVRDGRLMPTYDPRLAKGLEQVDLERPLPALWGQFDALSHVPVMVIRGANSDVLSRATVDAMRTRRPDLDLIEIDDQGHAPPLWEPDVIRRIASFVTRCNGDGPIHRVDGC